MSVKNGIKELRSLKDTIIEEYKTNTLSELSIKYETTNRTMQRFLKESGVVKLEIVNDIYLEKINLVRDVIMEKLDQGIGYRTLSKEFSIPEKVLKKHCKKKEVDKNANYDITFLDNLNNEATAYFLGFLWADGTLTNGGRVVSINLAQADREILDILGTYIFKEKPYISEYDVYNKQTQRTYKAVRLTISNKILVTKLIELGFGKKEERSAIIPDIDSDNIHHFFRGYFDGDGCFFNGEASVNGKESLLNKFADLIPDKSTRGISKGNGETTYRLSFNGKDTKKLIDILYKNSNIYLKRKHDKAANVLKTLGKTF